MKSGLKSDVSSSVKTQKTQKKKKKYTFTKTNQQSYDDLAA